MLVPVAIRLLGQIMMIELVDGAGKRMLSTRLKAEPNGLLEKLGVSELKTSPKDAV
jgi:hypothetical protein